MKVLVCDLTKQLPKVKKPKIVTGYFHLSEDHHIVNFYTLKDEFVAELRDPKVKFSNGVGIFLYGNEPSGFDKTGRSISKYQEWWIDFKEVIDRK